jgi:uncharacterized protein (DUF952 family)
MTTIYHMAHRADWISAKRTGEYHGTADDRRDGFIHFSTATQVAESAARHRKGARDLVLLAVDAEALGDALRWEPARGGALFPHVYGTLAVACVQSVSDLPLGPDGRHRFPALPP